jgi:hypothetical protein
VISFVYGIILFASGEVTCSQSSDVGSSPPIAVAALSTTQLAGEVSIAGQPFVAIAMQARASVVNISSVKRRHAVANHS